MGLRLAMFPKSMVLPEARLLCYLKQNESQQNTLHLYLTTT